MAHLVRALAATYADGYHIPAHTHGWGQLIYAVSGVMRVRAADTLWLVPPAQAIWAPAGVAHEIWARGDFAMRTLYFAPEFAERLPADCRALDVAPLLRELVLRIVQGQRLDDAAPAERRLAEVAVDLVADASVLPVSLPMPKDARAVRLAERLKDEPACEAELDALARDAGASARTVQRLFLDETGLRFSEWRQRLRLIHAASLLAEGASVTDAGLEAGYASTSAFIAAFRKRFGRTPARLRDAVPDEPARPEAVLRPQNDKGVPPDPAPALRSGAANANPSHREPLMKTRIGFALLGVTDLERSIAFYRDALGWPLVDRNPAEQYARLDAGGIGVKLLGGHEPTVLEHPVLEVVVDDLEAAYAELSSKGVEFPMPPTLMPWGGTLARFRDPDGHIFYLTPPA
jgi:AraC-like DNA-binding protein/catechol 2,3-dioxygenase-like lactoylglutathione lyase family enzyme